MNPTRKAGRPANYIVHPVTGKPIIGLSYDLNKDTGKGTKQYYLTHFKEENNGKKLYFGRDFDKAYLKFLQFMASKQGSQTVAISTKVAMGPWGYPGARRASETKRALEMGFPIPIPIRTLAGQVDKNILWGILRQLVAEDREETEKQLGFKILFTENEIAEASVSLQDIWDNFEKKPKYRDRKTNSAKTEYNDAKLAWNLFKEQVGKEACANIQKSDVRKFCDYTLAHREKHKLAPSWCKHVYQKIRWLLQMAIDDLDHTKYILQLKAYCDIFKVPQGKDKTEAKIFTIEDFHKILAGSVNSFYKALWITALNAAYYKIDLCLLPKKCVDLQTGLISGFPRTKTEEPRVCWLWQESKEILSQYQKDFPNNGTEFFFTENGKPLTEKRVYKLFQHTLKAAKLTGKYDTTHFRDSFEHTAKEAMYRKFGIVDQNQINSVMGHKDRGMDRHYTNKNGIITAIAETPCQLVHDHFFPQGSSKDTQPSANASQ